MNFGASPSRMPPTLKRGRYAAAAAIQRAYRNRLAWKKAYMQRGSGLLRKAIGSRVNVFKRTTDAFGIKAGITGTSTYEQINCGSSPDQLLSIANAAASQFATGAYAMGGAFKFELAHLSNVSEITNLYDNYRIKMVYVHVIPSFNSSDVAFAGTTGAMGIPMLHYTVDNDDAVVPTSRGKVMENSYAKSRRLDAPFTIAVKPRAQNVVATTAGSAAAGMLPVNQWLDCDSTTIPHYGLKFWLDEFPTVTSDTASRPFIKFTCTYILEAKNVV